MRSTQISAEHWWEFLQRGSQHLAKLEHEVQQWQVDTAELQRLELENAALRQQLSRDHGPTEQVAQWYGSDQQWFLDLGCEEGVREGALVTADGAFVGVVKASHFSYSEVQAWDDPSWRLASKVGTESAYGVFSFGRSIPEVEEVPSVYKDSVGAVVVTAGQEHVPPTYILGTVQEVVEEEGFGTVRMVVDPVIDLKKIFYVRVETIDGNVCSQENQ